MMRKPTLYEVIAQTNVPVTSPTTKWDTTKQDKLQVLETLIQLTMEQSLLFRIRLRQ
jgi:hypothetical protein